MQILKISSLRDWIRHISYLATIVVIVIAAHHTTLHWMYQRFLGGDSYYSHGFLVPLVTGYLIWRKRGEISKIHTENSWWGLIVIICGCVIHLTGVILYVFSMSGFALFATIVGSVIFVAGWPITKVILFPLIFLIFMFPLPSAFIGMVSFPLKMIVAHTGVWITNLLGIPVYQEGFYITIPAGSLLVGNPCSGLRSLIAFMALGSLLAYLGNLSILKKWGLFLLTIPIAILSNIVRVPMLIIISHYWGLEAAAPDTFVHTASGMLVFIIGFFLLIYAIKGLSWEK